MNDEAATVGGRVWRRRAVTGGAAVAVVAALLAGAIAGGHWLRGEPAAGEPLTPAGPPPSESQQSTLSWVPALVGRDDTTITVYAGPGPCEELQRPQAEVTSEDSAEVTISVTGRIATAKECATSDVVVTRGVVPLSVTLAAPLGDRVVVDAVTNEARPTYFERHLPDLSSQSRWSPVPNAWYSEYEGWHSSYNGPNGSVLDLRAEPATSPLPSEVVETLALGPYEGFVTDLANWTVWWTVGDATYSLRLVPHEGGTFGFDEFVQELARLKWS